MADKEEMIDKELKAIEDAASLKSFIGLHLQLIDELRKRKYEKYEAMDHAQQFMNSFFNYSNGMFCHQPVASDMITEDIDLEDS